MFGYTHIRVTKETKDRLKEAKYDYESYNDVIQRLLEISYYSRQNPGVNPSKYSNLSIDATSRKIIRALNKNPEYGPRELAETLRIDEAQVRYRLKKLKENGIYLGRTIEIDFYRLDLVDLTVLIPCMPKEIDEMRKMLDSPYRYFFVPYEGPSTGVLVQYHLPSKLRDQYIQKIRDLCEYVPHVYISNYYRTFNSDLYRYKKTINDKLKWDEWKKRIVEPNKPKSVASNLSFDSIDLDVLAKLFAQKHRSIEELVEAVNSEDYLPNLSIDREEFERRKRRLVEAGIIVRFMCRFQFPSEYSPITYFYTIPLSRELNIDVIHDIFVNLPMFGTVTLSEDKTLLVMSVMSPQEHDLIRDLWRAVPFWGFVKPFPRVYILDMPRRFARGFPSHCYSDEEGWKDLDLGELTEWDVRCDKLRR